MGEFQFDQRLEPRTVLDDRFVILSPIGQGAMGVVYKAEDRAYQRIVAVKMLHSSHICDEKSLRRFQREAQVISALDHPNIVQVYAIGVSREGLPYFVMEYLEGSSLCELFQSQAQVGHLRYLNIFIQALDALEHAHGRGVVHRDVKPRNIMLLECPGGQDLVKLVDFGVAKLLPEGDVSLQKLTQTGALVGSPLYMSPEHCRAGMLDARSDIYSLGCVMYEAVTGQPPFMDTVATKILQRHLSEQPLLFSKCPVRFPVPPTLEAVIFRAMSKLPQDRYQSASEMAAELKRIRSGERAMTETVTIAVQQLAASSKARRYLFKPVLTLALLVFVALSVIPLSLMWRRHHEEVVEAQVQQANLLYDKAYRAAHHNSFREADDLYGKALDLYLLASPADVRQAASAAYQQALSNCWGANYVRAAKLYPQALALAIRAFGKGHRRVAEVEADFGRTYVPLRQFSEAEPHLLAARSFYLSQHPLEMEKVLPVLKALAVVYYNLGRPKETELAYVEYIKYQELNGTVPDMIAESVNEYAAFLRAQGRIEDADKQKARAEELRRKETF